MEKRKLKSKKGICPEVSAKQSRESVESVLEKKRKATVGRVCRKEGLSLQ